MMFCRLIFRAFRLPIFFGLFLFIPPDVLAVNWMLINTQNSNIPSDYITSITQDPNGIIWITTDNGFAKYLGNQQWEIHHNPIAPSWNDICLSIVAQDSIIWVATVNGLVRHCNGNTTVYHPGNSSLLTSYIMSLAVEGQTLWIGTYLNGVYTYDQFAFQNYSYQNTGNMPLGNVYSTLIDENGDKWFVCKDARAAMDNSKALVKWDNTTWTKYDTSNSGIPIYATFITQDNSNNYWLTGAGGPLVKFDLTSWTSFDSNNIGYNAIFSDVNIAVDRNNQKWVCTSKGFSVFDDNSWQFYDSTNSAYPNEIAYSRNVYVDDLNNKWIGTNGRGIIVFNDSGIILNFNNPEQDQSYLFSFLNYNNNSLSVRVNKSTNVCLEIYNITGSLLISDIFSCYPNQLNEYPIDLTAFSSGMYILKVYDNFNSKTFKILN